MLRDTDGDGVYDASHGLRRSSVVGRRRRLLEGGRVRRRSARHLVLQRHRRRSQGRHQAEGLHRLRHQEPAVHAEQLEVGPRSQDLRLDGRQRRRDPPRRQAQRQAHFGRIATISASIRSPRSSSRSPARSSSATRSTIGATASCATNRSRCISRLPTALSRAQSVSARRSRRVQHRRRQRAHLSHQPDRALAAHPLEPPHLA